MMVNASILKRAYDVVALFALLNFLAIAGLVAFLVADGAIDAAKARRIIAVLRGQDLPRQQPAAADAATETEEQDTSSPDTGKVVAGSQMELEILRREGERIKAELDQRLALNNSILLRIMSERERFRRETDEAARRQQAALTERRREGFKKQIAIYESLAPKVAVQHLLALSQPEDAARILLEINTRKARKIVEAAKRGDQMEKMKVILQRVREVSPAHSEELESREP